MIKFFLSNNPALWFAILFLFSLISTIIFNYEAFSLEKTDLFTLFYTFPILITIHIFLSYTSLKSKSGGFFGNLLPGLKYITKMYLPYLFIVLIYENLILFNEAFNINSRLIDFSLMHIDAAIFGVQPTIWLQKLINPFVVEYLMLAYSMFFIYPFFYLIYLLQKNEIEIFQKVMLAEIIAVIIALISFLLFPAIGPRFTLDPASVHAFKNTILYSQNLKGLSLPFLNGDISLYSLQVDLWNYIERINIDCFPSLHACLCLICLIYALRFKRIFKYTKLAVWFWVIGVTSLVISTIYLRYHWVIDVIAGAILAIVVYFITQVISKSWHNLRLKHALITLNAPWLGSDSNRNNSD